MCGITGIWNWNGEPIDVSELACFTRALAHRGPDGEGFALLNHGSLGLGHQRLAILDLSEAGRQPMTIGEQPLWLTYNGEIFNFLELRAELEKLGYHFTTNTDTEVILKAFVQWGLDCLLKFNGMWAFGLWDESRQQLIVARDRYGIKPVLYFKKGNRFAFASEHKAFLHLRGCDYIPPEEYSRTDFWQGIEMVPPGHLLIVRKESIEMRRWWRARDHLPSIPSNYKAQVEQFRDLFLDSCRLRMRSDVPLATAISGGLDSSAVLGALAWLDEIHGDDLQRRASDWQRSFHACWPNTPQDERRYAEIAVASTGAKPVWYNGLTDDTLDASTFQEHLFQVEGATSLGFTAAWLLYRAMRNNGIVVTLDGQGADELMGGYDRHVRYALIHNKGYLLSPFRTLDLAKILHKINTIDGPKHTPHYPLYASLLLGSSLLQPVLKHLPKGQAIWGGIRQNIQQMNTIAEPGELEGLSAFGRLLYFWVHRNLTNLLTKFDRYSMSHSIEVRMPFLDWRLVNFVMALPDTSKLGRGYTKRILRDAMALFSPSQICQRKAKLGFSAPGRDVLRNSQGVQQWFNDQIHDPELQSEHPQFTKISQRLASGNIKIWEIDTGSLRTIISFWYRTKWATHGRRQSISSDVNSSAIMSVETKKTGKSHA